MAEFVLNRDNFYGNKALHEMLANSIFAEHLCHAYLFYAPKMLGKKTFSKYFARAILCEGERPNNKADFKPCGKCKSCKKALSDSHPDIFFYDGKEGKNALHIETIREIRQDAYILPNESEYKIYIIPNAQDMSIAAANAFLKVLEEPPKHTIFILTATSKTAVPETILSRCVSFEVFPLTTQEAVAALTEGMTDTSAEEIQNAAALCDGNLGRAIKLLSQEDTGLGNLAGNLLKAIANKDEYSLLKGFTTACSAKGDIIEVLDELLTMLRNTLHKKLKVGEITNENIVLASQNVTIKALYEIIEAVLNAKVMLDSNVNKGLLASDITARIISAL